MNSYAVIYKGNNKLYYFKSSEKFEIDDEVIVDTDKGEQYAKIVKIVDSLKTDDLKEILRKATKEDQDNFYTNIKDAELALVKARNFAKELDLNMNIINAQYTLNRAQLLFNFYAEERIDFRELARKLAGQFRTRIELRQVGSRDGAKVFGGIGPCGLVVCCQTFLTEFANVSVKMAKNQSLSLNPVKISGNCGKLLCCINYENDVYTELRKNAPDIGDIVSTEQGEAKVLSCDVLNHNLKVKYLQTEGFGYLKFEDVKILRAKKDKDKDYMNNKELRELL